MMTKRTFLAATAATILFGSAALAGPPLICERIDIGKAKSLPWSNSNGWNGVEPSYDVKNLTSDTLKLLTPGTPVHVRMETLRRAAVYSAKQDRLADEITARLTARALDSEAAGHSDANAWFDAGYFVEAVRQVTFVYKWNMLSPAEREQWKLRGEAGRIDGLSWVQRAIKLGGKGMEPAIAKINDVRQSDLRASGN